MSYQMRLKKACYRDNKNIHVAFDNDRSGGKCQHIQQNLRPLFLPLYSDLEFEPSPTLQTVSPASDIVISLKAPGKGLSF